MSEAFDDADVSVAERAMAKRYATYLQPLAGALITSDDAKEFPFIDDAPGVLATFSGNELLLQEIALLLEQRIPRYARLPTMTIETELVVRTYHKSLVNSYFKEAINESMLYVLAGPVEIKRVQDWVVTVNSGSTTLSFTRTMVTFKSQGQDMPHRKVRRWLLTGGGCKPPSGRSTSPGRTRGKGPNRSDDLRFPLGG